MRKISRYENLISYLKPFRKNKATNLVGSSSFMHERWFLKFKEFESYIAKQKPTEIVQKLRKPFYQVEKSSEYVQAYELALIFSKKGDLSHKSFQNNLDSLGVSSNTYNQVIDDVKNLEPKAIKRKLNKAYRRLGVNYDKYYYFRSRFDSFKNSTHCKKSCQLTISKLYEQLQVKSSLDDIRRIYEGHPQAIAISRKREFLNEGLGLMRNILLKLNLIQRSGDFLYKQNLKPDGLLIRFLEGVFNRKARDLHLSVIDKISHLKLTSKQRLDLFEKEYLKLEDDGFLVNFYRHNTYASEKALVDIHAQALKTNNQILLNRLERAKIIATRLGPYNSSRLGQFLSYGFFIAGTGGMILYMLPGDINIEDEQIEGREDHIEEVIYESEKDNKLFSLFEEFALNFKK